MTLLYDYTSLSCLQGCEQEWQYRHVQHLASPRTDASQLFGQAVHAGVRALFAGEDPSGPTVAAWGAGHEDPKKAHLTVEYARKVVQMYGLTHSGSPLEMVLNEQYLEWPERHLCGIVDRVVRSRTDGQLYVMDLKTTGLYLSQAWFEQWRHSLQAAIYLDLVEMDLDLKPGAVAGFWVDALHVNRRGYPKPEDFMRVGPFPYSESLRSELRATVSALVREADATRETGVARKNTRSCFRYNALCPFFRYCTVDDSDRADVVKMALASGELVEREWAPALR